MGFSLTLQLAVLCLFLSGFFSGVEMAFISSDRLKIKMKAEKGQWISRILHYFREHQSLFLTTILIGNNLALVLYGIFMGQLLRPIFLFILPPFMDHHLVVLILQTIVATLFVISLAEFLPKSLFRMSPNTMLGIFSIPITLFFGILYPLTYLIHKLSTTVIRAALGVDPSSLENRYIYGIGDLSNYIRNSFRSVPRIESSPINPEVFYNAESFSELRVRDCMIPRTDIVAVPVEADIGVLKDAFIQSGHSRILVFDKSLDEDVKGYAVARDMFKSPRSITEIIHPLLLAHETRLAGDLLRQFREKKSDLSLVVDEFGGTAGIISIEDIIEEIFGEIRDEHDGDALTEIRESKDLFTLSGRLELDYLNHKYNLRFPPGDYETLGGYITTILGNIPKVGQVLEGDGHSIRVVEMKKNMVGTVRLTVR